ncbi:hypothetical protein SBI_06395 [Streptomyces bingchenggensis BCW-1]|uniref:DNA-binding protein n=1 Tax=Streptomyces bingchenggensis (strain BCW-1) TaxID=749414 RepID=D7BTU6_STRBB|nr:MULTISPECIES: hypothetical protein [Streptomyces]ADI09515.1 hypothetical protein SBI_06395 [Streptomyces bingchenggensis BCW-1]
MAEPQSNAHARADAGASTSGVIHIRTRLTRDFTVIANALAQRRGSAVTIGVAAYILSLPDGAPVSIAALCEHFTEGEILISRALRELEAAGYLERRRERGPGGLIRTRTYFRDVPQRDLPALPPRPRNPTPPAPEPTPTPAPTPPPPLDEADEQAVALLASLRIADPRLILSRREVAELAPAVTQWLAAGVGPRQITGTLTTGLPDRLRARPARILAFRLSEPPLAVPESATGVPRTSPVNPLPWQTCDGCERAFRAAEPSRCRDCRELPVAC